MAESGGINWFFLFMGLFGGLALFLFGLDQLSEGLKKAAGSALKTMMARLTANRIMGIFTGAVVTGVLNSSSVTTVLVVGFVNAGIMTLGQSVSVIMGANIGSTVTAQILAFNVSQYAMLPIAVGFFMTFLSRQHQMESWGRMIMGLGLVFFGMGAMGEAMHPLRQFQPFLDLLGRMENPFLGILAGALFTGLVQSSAATVGIAIAMASGGLLSLSAGIALALGANIGTCITAMMAAMGKPAEAKQVAAVHVAFNVLGVLIWLPFIPYLAEAAALLSPGIPGPAAADVPRQIANANTIFNIANTLAFVPFTAAFAWLARKLVKAPPEPPKAIEPKYLDSALLALPAVALDGVRKELTRVAGLILNMMERYQQGIVRADYDDLRRLPEEDDKIDILEMAIIKYLGQIRATPLSREESLEHQRLMSSIISLENMGDVIEKDLVGLAFRVKEMAHRVSDKTAALLSEIYIRVHRAMVLVIPMLAENDLDAARKILALDDEIGELAKALLIRKSARLGSDAPDALKSARIEVSMADKLSRVYRMCRRLAWAHLDEWAGTKAVAPEKES